MDRPNVVFLISDQHSAKVLGHKGDPNVKTPNLDRMAEEGVRFDNCICQNPVCTPSRVSWLSGQYCHNHGFYGLCGPHPNGLPSILGHFQNAGYQTCYVGKAHTPEYWIEDHCDEFHSAGPAIGGRPEYEKYMDENKISPPKPPKGRGRFEFAQELDGFPDNVPHEKSTENWVFDQSKQFMERCKKDGKPFIVCAGFQKPHQPYRPSPEFWDLYNEEKIQMPPNADYEMELKAPNLINTVKEFRDNEWTLFEPKTYEAGRRRKLRGYLGNVSQVDHTVGQFLDFLKESGLDENTIIIYTSDHGDFACEHGAIEKAPGICADAITRVPFIWRWPKKFKNGHVATEIVESVDLANTLCSLCSIEEMETADGYDLSPLLAGNSKQVHSLGVTEFPWSRSIRKDNFRLVTYPKQMFAKDYPDGFGELYDLESDPWEMKNLYFDPEYQDIVHSIQKEFLDWLVVTTRPVTTMGITPYTSRQSRTRYKQTINEDGKVSWKRLLTEEGKGICWDNYQ